MSENIHELQSASEMFLKQFYITRNHGIDSVELTIQDGIICYGQTMSEFELSMAPTTPAGCSVRKWSTQRSLAFPVILDSFKYLPRNSDTRRKNTVTEQ